MKMQNFFGVSKQSLVGFISHSNDNQILNSFQNWQETACFEVIHFECLLGAYNHPI